MRDFREAVVRFVELHDFNEVLERGVAPALWPRSDADEDEIARLRAAVKTAAARAVDAARVTGVYVGVSLIDPVVAWSSMTAPHPLVEPDDVLAACDEMLARLDGLIWRADAEMDAVPATGVEACTR